mmetsp:Transcript_22339/g.44323  ORF Transcript_22339/g.44323 Transcript_22339/m.44323 type:complete len:447 (+) Transcript_22339:35-1375(+)|eukprot:CAMPEP_0175139762 /NCGR_PEP_ID=MMETSP0087-20121206/11093_1 /TAXON_ID=136419 /ORGANISM="Unknown Unknown, Strain D1" /LENGTH=446 /DNA_ID=CAMNT_0016422829 /DNA_START=31 /DNA_END=1371 /DNA_ORIENTATION=+
MKCIIVGIGPAGIATAGFLAKNGWEVECYDKLTRESASVTTPKYLERAYGLSGHRRMLDTLAAIDAENDVYEEGAYRRDITIIQTSKGIPIPMPPPKSPTIAVLRTELVGGLIKAVERQFKNVQLHWSTKISGVEFRNGKAVVKFENGHESSPDLVVCAEGAFSYVGRPAISSADPTFECVVKPRDVLTKQLYLNQPPTSWRKRALYMLPSKNGDIHMLIRDSPSLGENLMSCMLVYPTTHPLFSKATTGPALSQAIQHTFPEAQLPLREMSIAEEMERCATTAPHHLPPVVTSNKYHYGNLVVLGDAAHSSPVNAAQGVNTALEDAFVLNKCLHEEGLDICAALERFTRVQKPQHDALQRLMAHPMFRTVAPTWRTKTIDFLRDRLALDKVFKFLQYPQVQLNDNKLSYTQVEQNLRWQYHCPAVLVGAVAAIGFTSACFSLKKR